MAEGWKVGRVSVRSWAIDLEAGAREQADNLSRLPFALHHVALMPDAHKGYGMPVGGVLFADKAVVPYAIGVDIGCGVALIETEVAEADLTPAKLNAVLQQILRDVPVGNGPAGEHASYPEPFSLPGSHRQPSEHALEVAGRVGRQLGTLGGGNHFLEVQADDDGRVWCMLHSGSRRLGKEICDRWHKVALGLNTRWFSDLPHPELAYLPWGTEEAAGYWADMEFALAWAEENRSRMATAMEYSITKVMHARARQVLDVHHNYAAWEQHYGHSGIVHRKGAVRANEGEPVLIPGSMSTGSYLGTGLGNAESFHTCQHGAGRARSRTATRGMMTIEVMNEGLDAAGVLLVTPNRGAAIEEVALAYKDVDAVMAASTDLVEAKRRHRPLGVVKG